MSVISNTSGVNSIMSSPYLADVLDQPRALSALLDSAPSIAAVPDRIGLIGRPRVLVSGMGSSHVAGLRIWTTLVRMGVPAWWVETTQLLDLVDGIVEPNTLLWLTSQSGESAEAVAVLERVADQDVHIVG